MSWWIWRVFTCLLIWLLSWNCCLCCNLCLRVRVGKCILQASPPCSYPFHCASVLELLCYAQNNIQNEQEHIAFLYRFRVSRGIVLWLQCKRLSFRLSSLTLNELLENKKAALFSDVLESTLRAEKCSGSTEVCDVVSSLSSSLVLENAMQIGNLSTTWKLGEWGVNGRSFRCICLWVSSHNSLVCEPVSLPSLTYLSPILTAKECWSTGEEKVSTGRSVIKSNLPWSLLNPVLGKQQKSGEWERKTIVKILLHREPGHRGNTWGRWLFLEEL